MRRASVEARRASSPDSGQRPGGSGAADRGRTIQILTVRDTADPDGSCKRHSAAHRCRGRATSLPGCQGRDRPADRERLLLRLRFPGADHRGRPAEDRGRGRRELKEGRSWSDARSARRGAPAVLEENEPHKVGSSTPPRATSRLHPGRLTDLCRGPHLQNSKPIKAFADRFAGAYWRGEHNKQRTASAHRVLQPGRLDVSRAAEEAQARPPSSRRSTSSTWRRSRPLAVLHPKGMVIWNGSRLAARERAGATSRVRPR